MALHVAPNVILVKREGALGDVFDTTPVVARLRAGNPDAVIHVQTAYPQVYERNPHAQLRPDGWPDEAYARIIDLDMAFEKRLRRISAIDAYMLEAFGDMGEGHSKQLVYQYDRALPNFDIDWGRTVTFNPARSWPQRTLPLAFWEDFCESMLQRGFTPVAIGTDQDWTISLSEVLNTRMPLRFQVAAIAASRVYVGSASGPCTYAHATDTPIISLLTMSPWWGVAHERHGQMGWGFRGLEAPIACQGCGARQTNVCTYHSCERGDNLCTMLFDPSAVADTACEMAETYLKH
jgi:hypothetical protein